MIDGGPYRSSALVVVQSHREHAYCPWCTHASPSEPWLCEHVALRSSWGSRKRCQDVNPAGACDHYQPSLLTRILRVFGWRMPLLVSVTERDIKPDNSPRGDGLGRNGGGGRGGNVGGGTGLRIGKRFD